MSDSEMISTAIGIAIQYGGTDGDHHKAWVIDQMVRVLTGCPTVMKTAKDCNGKTYEYEALGKSEEYLRIVAAAKVGDDGPDSYEWSEGIPP